MRLREVPLGDRESAYHGTWSGDAMLLGLVVGVLLVNGVIIWNQLGPGQEHVRRALFFGVLLVSMFWAAFVYTFKLSVSVRVGPHGLAIVRGPWRTELPWREVTRLVERIQTHRQQRYRWVVALARDGRRLQVREDMVADYGRFRYEVYERYRLWQDHGGTWGTAGGGPFMAREVISGRVTWWSMLAVLFLLPGLYFTVLLPETGLVGPILLALGIAAGVLAVQVVLGRQSYTVDARSLKAAGPLRTLDLAWRDVSRVERLRHPFSGALEASIKAGRFALALAARTDPRVESFAWYPRVPEYLALRGTGRQVRIALHRVARPDELLAWVEFYERVGRRSAEQARRPSSVASGRPAREELPANLAAPGGPSDPWGASAPGGESEGATAADQSGGWEVSVGGMSFIYDRAPGRATERPTDAGAGAPPQHPAPQEAPRPAEAAPEWSVGQGYHSGLTGSIDQLWSESRVDYSAAPPPGERGSRFTSAGPGAAPDAVEPEPAMPAEHSPAGWTADAQRSNGHAGPGDAGASGSQGHEAWGLPGGVPDETETGGQDGPTDAVDSLADMFAPWRTNPRWSPPPLPRYGPTQEQPAERRETPPFADDEFLR